MRKIYTAITIMLFAMSSFAAQDLATEFITNSAQAQLSTTILEFTVPDQVSSTINAVDFTVSVTMPLGTDLTELVPAFTLAEGATAWIGEVAQVSQTTVNDFTEPVTYTIKNGDASQDWVVTVLTQESVMVTFNVNMGECAGDDVVYLVGGFIWNDGNWPEPGSEESIEMTDADGDGIYTAEVEIAANTNDRYKYFVGAGWNGGDLYDGGCENKDRCLVLGTEDVTFDDVFECIDAVIEKPTDIVSIYPNPVNAELTIANLEGVSKVTVSNLLGQALVTRNVTAAKMTINTSDLKTGIYVVTLVSENGSTRSERIVKQ
jgi:hypothetical protein